MLWGAVRRIVVAAALAVALIGGVPEPSSGVPRTEEGSGPGTFHVSLAGDDDADGTPDAPWRSIQHATSTAPVGATIVVDAGTYDPFEVTRIGQTVAAATPGSVTVQGRAGVRDVILVTALGASLEGLTVSGCLPHARPIGGLEDEGSASVRIDDSAWGVTVRDLQIREGRGVNPDGLPFGCFGFLVHGAHGTRIIDNDISGMGAGIFFNGGGRFALVSGNQVHDNDVTVRNTIGNNDDFGAVGIGFANVRANPGPVVTENDIYNNAGSSADYGFDGAAFEVYNSSHLRLTGNNVSNNESVLEAGTSPGGGCRYNEFSSNNVSGRTGDGGLERSVGMILRCATGMIVSDNTFTDLDGWVYSISAGDMFASDVDGLSIVNNKVSSQGPIYELFVDPYDSGVVIDANLSRILGPVFAIYGDRSTSADLADWQRRTGFDLAGEAF